MAYGQQSLLWGRMPDLVKNVIDKVICEVKSGYSSICQSSFRRLTVKFHLSVCGRQTVF